MIRYHNPGQANSAALPVVNAGADQSITLPLSTINLSGIAAAVGGATIISQVWTLVSGPNVPIITSPASLATTVTGLVAGSYIFRLSATDSNGQSANDSMTVNVNVAVVTFTANWGWSTNPFALVAPYITAISDVTVSATRTIQYQVGASIITGCVYNIIAGSHLFTTTAIPGDTAASIAARLNTAISTSGYVTSSSVAGDTITIVLPAILLITSNYTVYNAVAGFGYQKNGVFVHNAAIGTDFSTAPGGVFIILKIPSTEPNPISYFNTVLNNGAIPDAVMFSPVTSGGYTYVWSRVAPSLDTTQLLTFHNALA